MITLNMLPEVKREYLRARKAQARVISIAIILSLAAAGLVVLSALWVFGAQALQRSSLEKSIEKNYAELREIPEIDRYVTVQNQLTQIDGLHGQKAILSRVFDVVAKLNPQAPNNVRIASLNVNSTDGTMTFEGETSSFTGLETFRDTLKNAELVVQGSENEKLFPQTDDNPPVSVVNQSIGTNDKGKDIITFNVVARYNPKVFARDAQNVTIFVPNRETTQTKVSAPDTFAQPTKTEAQ